MLVGGTDAGHLVFVGDYSEACVHLPVWWNHFQRAWRILARCGHLGKSKLSPLFLPTLSDPLSVNPRGGKVNPGPNLTLRVSTAAPAPQDFVLSMSGRFVLSVRNLFVPLRPSRRKFVDLPN